MYRATMFLLAIIATMMALSSSMPAISVVASVRGKKYDVSDVETVDEFTQKVEGLVAGMESGQSSVLFRGKVLSGTDNLEEAGVTNGDVLMVVKGRKQRSSKADFENDDDLSPSVAGGSSAVPTGFEDAMDPDAMKQAMANVDPAEMQKAMKAMDNLLDSNFVEEYFADDERLENARQQMLDNAEQYEKMMPGFKDQAMQIAADPVKWREAMLQAKEQITKLKAQRETIRASQGTTAPESGDAAPGDE